ncbi:39S ribosomal protein L19, mitochondrial [Episyrphus balteatus]|uniref:39S ribosomal protein L19, mitochondrial n=1 Tax=Episyrphus balteatus TaxID=286459 RepID=UPI0024853243|nr:39S ribosomal protein L19, mitochondrial [Episyrphus balteatus]XP_055857263.1 39S ribosomal protein L19, mitochondrial [Episyrphus balteatus]
MNVPGRIFNKNALHLNTFKRIVTFSTKPQLKESPPVTQSSSSSTTTTPSPPTNPPQEPRKPITLTNYRFIYPEFLPDPKIEWRNSVREKLERMDMVERRKQIDIPEFYVGSILAVTSSDPHAAGKVSRFVGICIDRDRCGLRARFILRNVVDHQGCEVLYEMYDPTIHKIEVLRLEKRLDDKLYYLRDALPEYSTFDLNMEADILPEGTPVPINDIQVKLKPRPWLERWERQDLLGVSNIHEHIKEKHILSAERVRKPWEKYDMMKQYRSTIPEEEQKEIFAEVHSQLHQLELARKKMKRKRTFIRPTNLA